ncbi:MAG TPA: heparan-alpha-glucosaminide N-acetyltransferase domain-containing protein [Polyangiales bacterium]|nr:heparan-alpha-glucosaminide N-acetyltransferase domain-containing protein [Polyangiales bacterium]
METASATVRTRLRAIDVLRGFVMVLMAIDHASDAFNRGRLFTDSSFFYKAGTHLDTVQFLTRFITHLCAPTFLFLAGVSGALSAELRIAAGEPSTAVDRHLLARGALIAVLDPTWMTLGFTGGHLVIFQVLYAIGMSMMCMVPLRRLSTRALVLGSLALMLGGEALVGAMFMLLHVNNPPLLGAFTISGGRFPGFVVAYPFVPWLAIMMLGWACGRWLAFSAPARPERVFARCGVAALLLFVVVRGLNGYGNLRLYREDQSLVQWLHVSKYPPALTYYTLLLGIMALLLSALIALEKHGRALPGERLLALLGRTAFFFYLLHAHILEAVAHLLQVHSQLGVWSAYAGGFAIVALLYPACVRYDAYKRAHPHGFARYL